jgi:hypothetical protein
MNTCGNVAGQALLALHLIHFSVGVSCPGSVVLLGIRSRLGATVAYLPKQACDIAISMR